MHVKMQHLITNFNISWLISLGGAKLIVQNIYDREGQCVLYKYFETFKS